MRLFVGIFVALLIGCPSSQYTQRGNHNFKKDEFMSVKEVRELLKSKKERGEKLIVQGRTVFEGTKIEVFEVDMLDVVLFGGFVKRPIFLARAIKESHPWIAKAGVAAGMSGSPMYINGKLIGALAYGWGLERDTDQLLGITPIEFMLQDARDETVPKVLSANAGDYGLRPLSVPITISGLPVDKLKRDKLRRFPPRLRSNLFMPEFRIVPQSSNLSAELSVHNQPDKFEEGSFLGVQFARGDVDMVGYGTVTYVKNDIIIGFGHPMFGSGEIEVPMTGGVVHTMVTDLFASYKAAGGGKLLGALVKDRDACVVGRVGPEWINKVKMIPAKITISNPKENVNQVINVEIINHKLFFPYVLDQVAYLSRSTFEPAMWRDRVISTKIDVNLVGGKKLSFENVYCEEEYGGAVLGSGEYDLYDKLTELLNNPWQKVELESVNITNEFVNKAGSRYLKEVWPVENEVEEGGEVKIKMLLKRRYTEDQTKEISFRLPKDLKKGLEVVIRVGGGAFMYPEIPPYSDYEGLLEALQIYTKNKDIIAETSVESFRFMYKGKDMEKIPLSVLALLSTSVNERALLNNITIRQRYDSNVIVVGSASVRVKIK